jgi:hypothetical protein
MFSRMFLGLACVQLTACNLKLADTTVTDEEGPTCDLKLTELVGTEWVYAEALPGDKGEKPQYKTRARFEDKDGKMIAKYTVGSLADVYEYQCESKVNSKTQADELVCKQEASIDNFCMAVMAGGERCALKPMQRINPDWTKEEIEASAEKTKASIAEMKEKGEWDRARVLYNNLLNKIQGILYAGIDKENCRLMLTDNYVTVYNGSKIEDSNPAGINAYDKNEGKGLLFKPCTAPYIFDTDSAEFPADPGNVTMTFQNKQTRPTGDPIHYWMLYGDLRMAQEGCTYSYDVWVNYQLQETGKTPESVDAQGGKELRWYYSHTFNEKSDMLNPHVLSFDITKTCGEKVDNIVACNAVITD